MNLIENLEVIVDEYGNVGLSFGELKDGEIEEIKQQILNGQKALEELRYVKEINNGLDFQCETLQTENQKLKAQLSERVSTANKIIAEKIDEIRVLSEKIIKLEQDKFEAES